MALIGTLTSGVSALRTFSKGLEVIGNNIANVNTTAFKSSQATFAESFSNTLQNSTPSNGTVSSRAAIQTGTGVKLAGVATNFSQGALSTTGVTTDLAISGSGYFMVRDASSEQQFATRDGSFRIDDNGYLVTQSGMRVQGLVNGAVGDIRLGQNLPTGSELVSMSIDTGGNIEEFYSDGTSDSTNRVLLQIFNDPAALMSQGNNLYGSVNSAGPLGGSVFAGATSGGNDPGVNGLGRIQSGQLEQSNVDLTEQFADLITTQRSFQAGSRLITVSDSVLEDIVNLKRS